MNDHVYALVLGFVQGLTEFLPVSSSGHLVLLEHALPGWHPPGVLFDAVLHLGTLLSVLVFYASDIARIAVETVRGTGSGRRFVGAVVLASIPTAAIGLGFQDQFEAWFARPDAVGAFLIVTAAMLFVAARYWDRANIDRVGWLDALLIGVAQGLAITPGISRSGSTVTVGLIRGIEPATAARFSFLMSVPAICGAVLLKFIQAPDSLPPTSVVIVGFVAAALSGYWAIRVFVGTLVRGRFRRFAWYCLLLGIAARCLF
ncbi:MAG: undecaprenyl-diphosphate phosphatase [Candidatus Dadabacteria bacterium]|nr:MAG: undecaprenyl-diphosphate phosphatase [Candidatus Dadabacteria bacterium]